MLLDGDLQDPPELIEQFVEQWREGYDVVYGRARQARGEPVSCGLLQGVLPCLRLSSPISAIPHDAGDFSLIDKRVVQAMLQFPERDLFLRGVRAFAGLSADRASITCVRSGCSARTTNNLLKNIGWAKKGILSFSNTPLNMLTFSGVCLFGFSLLLSALNSSASILFPRSVPPGITTTLLMIIFFGSVNLLGVSLLGEYLGKVFEEVKRRPLYIRRSMIRDGELAGPTNATIRPTTRGLDLLPKKSPSNGGIA